MNKKLFRIIFGIGIFAGGVILGKVSKKTKPPLYAGSLQVYIKNGLPPELYLALEVPPEDLIESADVLLKVNKIK
jgi:hypothetical protein